MSKAKLKKGRQAFQQLRREAKKRGLYEAAKENARKRKGNAYVDKQALREVLPDDVFDQHDSKTDSGSWGSSSSSSGKGPFSSKLRTTLTGIG